MWKFKLGLAAVAIVGGVGFSMYDRANNYVHVQVRADKVEQLCYGKSTESGVLSKTTRTTKIVDCQALRDLVDNHPDFKDFKVYENTYVSFRYKSPVDNKTHKARIIETKNLEGQRIKTHDIFEALVSKISADKALPL